MSQIVPYLWHENLNLEKETYTIILKEGGKAEIPLAKVKISENEDGKREITIYDEQEEKWIIYLDDQKKDIKLESISVYDEFGLEIESMAIDYLKDKAEITVNKYKMRE